MAAVTPVPDPFALLEPVAALEDAWRPETRPDIRVRPGCWGAEPYPVDAFLWLLGPALGLLAGLPGRPVFGDAGAGVGGKVLLAAAAGCDAWGVEAVPAYAAAARAAGADVRDGRVLDAAWAGTHIVYTNQLYRHAAAQAAYERALRDLVAPGTILVSVNHAGPPGPPWVAALHDPAWARGVYLKTGGR